MWPFNRKPKSYDGAPAMPPELNDYYQAEKRQQVAVTWLLGFATLAATVAIAFGLFLGARWLVVKVRNTPSRKPSTSQQENTNNVDSSESDDTNNNTNTPEPSNQGAADSQSSSATTNLPNTGPADSLALFCVATAVGVFTYRRKVRS